jgi:hypothetical protein
MVILSSGDTEKSSALSLKSSSREKVTNYIILPENPISFFQKTFSEKKSAPQKATPPDEKRNRALSCA